MTAGITAVLTVGRLGAVTDRLELGDALRVIASSVIGGTSLTGGAGTAFGNAVGAALIEEIRNSLLPLGVDAFRQVAFVGLYILLAAAFERFRIAR